MSSMIVLAANKGGVGKTTLALEIAYALDAILVDLDWDAGGATRAWGYPTEGRTRSSLLAALTGSGKTPQPVHGPGRPALVPSHPLLAEVAVTPEAMAERLTATSAPGTRPTSWWIRIPARPA